MIGRLVRTSCGARSMNSTLGANVQAHHEKASSDVDNSDPQEWSDLPSFAEVVETAGRRWPDAVAAEDRTAELRYSELLE